MMIVKIASAQTPMHAARTAFQISGALLVAAQNLPDPN